MLLVEKVKYNLTTLECENSSNESDVVELQVFDMNGNNLVYLSNVYSRPVLPVSICDIPRQEDLQRWPHLDGIDIPNIDAAEVGLLIGQNNSTALEPLEIRHSHDGGPFAVKTLLGWAINGPLGRSTSTRRVTANFTQLDQQFRDYCNREFDDSVISVKNEMSQDDKRAVNIMNKTSHIEDDHYVISLPFRNDTVKLPNNRLVAEHRLNLLQRRLSKDANLSEKYKTFMATLLDKKYAEKVPDSEMYRDDGLLWYLPHHPVINPNKPEKVRVVFDCSAKFKDVSLNDNLLQGPDLTNNLIGVLTRFRQNPIALMSDIEAMFHQVHVTPECRDVLRFLWWPGGHSDGRPCDYRMRVHLFGAVSSPSVCNYALKRTADDHQKHFDQLTINTVHNNFYVDDCLQSVADEDHAVKLIDELCDLLALGGFHLTKWISNSTTVMMSIPEDERANVLHDLDFGPNSIERALGVHWDISNDLFRYKISIKERPATRRGILSVMSSIYDPLGFVAPIVLPVKTILQELCKQGLKWDDPIPDCYVTRWKTWLFELHTLESFSIDICIQPMECNNIITRELHHFSDASETGYGSVSYLRILLPGDKVHCTFIMGKSRTVPLKQITIPRLELSAATLAVRQHLMITRELELPIDRVVFWTDSTSVLKFIRNTDRRFQTFVANRIAQIHDGSEISSWKYVPSELNPADDASRGLSTSDLSRGCRWSMGPGFLRKPDDWPVQPDNAGILPDDHPEVRLIKSGHASVTVTSELSFIDQLITRFSTWHKLKKCLSWILRYRSNLLAASRDRKSGAPWNHVRHDILAVTVDEMRHAESEIIMHVQKQSNPDEMNSLVQDGRPIKKSSSICKLNPIMMEGILRVGGRLARSSLDVDSKHQIILPKNHRVSALIINHYHTLSGHSGREYVLALLRRRYWITHGNSAVRTVLTRCVECKKTQGCVGTQKMADLPADARQARIYLCRHRFLRTIYGETWQSAGQEVCPDIHMSCDTCRSY